MLVTSASQAAEAGDEPALIVQSTGVPMAVGPNRQAAIELLLASTKLDLIISDDGLQHWALGRQIEWIVLDQNRGLGNRKLLPEGYLREPAERLKTSTVIEHTFTPTTTLHMHLDAGQPYLLNPSSATELSFNIQNNYHAVVGIGFPQRFYQTLKGLGGNNFKSMLFVITMITVLMISFLMMICRLLQQKKMRLNFCHCLKNIQTLNVLSGLYLLKLFCLQSAIRF